jgi:hypothetical protein
LHVTAFGFNANRKSPEHLQALERVKVWTRARFRIPDEAPVLVSELACTLPDCAPLETVVAFWTEDAERHHFKIFKPVQSVEPGDFPAHWIDDARFAMDGTPMDGAGMDGAGCACC